MKAELIIIETDADLAEATALVEALRADATDAASTARLRAQARLVEDYERQRWPRKAPSMPQLLTYLMDQHDLTRADLAPLLGGAGRVSEVLNGKINLSMSMVRRLRERFGISADLLIPAGNCHRAAA
jgi:HTH-type transcriptional regulator / antitoxin HigA